MTGRISLTALACTLVSYGAEPVTFTRHIAPIVFRSCASCHRPGEAAPFPLLSYDDVRKHASQIVRVTKQRFMPPWLPVAGHGDFSNDRHLTDAQIALFSAWVDGGTPEGDPAALPKAPQFSPGWELGEPDLIVKMHSAYTLPGQLGDVFRNFILPVELKETKYIRAMELRPGNKRVVHHANLIVDRARQLRRRDGEDGQPGFAGMEVITEGGGDSGEFDPESHFLFWKPGTQAQQSEPDMAWKLDPGSDLIVNLHLQPSGKPELIEATVGLYFSRQPPKRFPMLVQLEHDGALDIPPGAASFSVTDHLDLPMAADVLAVYPHAHYIGKKIEAWAELPKGGGRRDLLLISDWDINWQATYTYRKPVPLPAGTRLAMRITYDNTATNPRNPTRPPRRVKAGNRSDDEMGHVWFQVLPRPPAASPGDPRLDLQQAVMRRRLEKYPGDFTANFNIGASMQAQGRHRDALPYLEKAAAARPASGAAHNNLAMSFLELDRVFDALREFRRAIDVEPPYQAARYNLASVLTGQGDLPGAWRELEPYLLAVPDDAQALDLAGRIWAAQGRFSDSIPYFRKAAGLQPSVAGYHTNLGAALAQSGNLRDAVTAFERALAADPASEAAKANLARAKSALGLR